MLDTPTDQSPPLHLYNYVGRKPDTAGKKKGHGYRSRERERALCEDEEEEEEEEEEDRFFCENARWGWMR